MKEGVATVSMVKEIEVRMALFVTEHNLAFTASEHLPKPVKRICPDSEIAKQVACSRTKTTAIIKAVTGEESKPQLWSLLSQNKFSVMIDELPDISSSKHLCVVARVFDSEKDSGVRDNLCKASRSCKKLFLQFLSFVLPIFNTLNKQMQSEEPPIHRLLKTATTALQTIMDCYIKRSVTRGPTVDKVD
ncbi:hypothetical protein HPB48_003560 [Haemaphysalis longicornis]|uniref:DUF4371 domain-containing protein n=1 Tax=Haemaphysalis longicornis TaxID=44386 RepID=A0A9J6FS44_HAELO|nr:hypothetical protein HPB48_003560 [Haemaphysalis longicornis]